MPLDLVKTLSELVATPSVNPMGHLATGPEFLETRVTARLEEYFRSLNLPVERQTVEPGRDNILTRLDGSRLPEEGGELVLWEVHQDTVPVTGMTIPPFTPEIRDGRLFGRGRLRRQRRDGSHVARPLPAGHRASEKSYNGSTDDRSGVYDQRGIRLHGSHGPFAFLGQRQPAVAQDSGFRDRRRADGASGRRRA